MISRWLRLSAFAFLLAAHGACSSGTNNQLPPTGGPFSPDAGTTTVTTALCSTAHASEDLSPRADLTGSVASSSGGTEVVHLSDLFVRFYAVCGSCHVDSTNGGKHVDQNSFATTIDATWLAAITSDDPKVYMPPPPAGAPFSSRKPDDQVAILAAYLDAWLAAGRPSDVFTIASTVSSSSSGYMFTPDMANAMTNLGNCVPNAAGFATDTSGMMQSKDDFFASATALPTDITDTDLTTFDSATLAATGVVAYVPTYPLWSAGSGKLRHIRVPRGQTVKFNKDKQSFDIPPNTRFYKTFFRKVLDRTGNLRNRKMETRVIVARPSQVAADGTVEQTALFGTYVWSDDETSATLANLPYRDGTTHADQVRTYITDELAYQGIIDSIGPGADFEAQLEAAVNNALQDNPNLQMHYAIPGRLRCVQCHMGSATNDFVLGFFPLQVARRANGTGGTYEPTGDDEVTQLQRLIDYGVISGIDSPADVLPLEQSQGSRKPRTSAELTAQAYMIGNCGHCHNPAGFPSVSKPELANVLQFYPNSGSGGIFELPFELMSPVRSRGANQDIPVPYITPSLYDYPVTKSDLVRMDNGVSVDPTTDGSQVTWTPKFNPDGNAKTCSKDNPDKLARAYCGDRTSGPPFVLAPWRSLIYRNVDTPFPYFDDFVPFPHMPMNSAGYDCRAPRIMGDWMVSLPSVRKKPELIEYWLPNSQSTPGDGTYDDSPQPYREVRPGDLDENGVDAYPAALAAADARLAAYHDGVRYQYCQDILGADIFDTNPGARGGIYRPDVTRFLLGGQPPDDPTRTGEYAQPPIGVPYHAHWFNYDPTDPPPPWSPRRADWQDIIVNRKPDTALPAGGGGLSADLQHTRQVTVEAVNEASLTNDLRTYATTETPFALWQQKPECAQKLAAQPTISSLSNPPAWVTATQPSGDALVYMTSPGAALYRNICFNCHGPKADGHGLQADALAASSEGEARPANFHEGLFGPSSSPGANLLATFGTIGTSGADMTVALAWGSRYMAWMALGGTLKRIPEDIISQVEATRVFGEARQDLVYLPGSNTASANMLNLAKGLCSVFLPDLDQRNGHYGQNDHQQFVRGAEPMFYPPYNFNDTPLIAVNGDKEMWTTLCTRFSPLVVRVYVPTINTMGGGYDVTLQAFYYADGYPPGAPPPAPAAANGYPPNAPVLDDNRVQQMGVSPTNHYPACLDASDKTAVAWLADKPIRTTTHMPDCPPQFLANTNAVLWRYVDLQFGDDTLKAQQADNMLNWELRGAIATGMTVFSYLQSGGAQMPVKPYYNECQLLP